MGTVLRIKRILLIVTLVLHQFSETLCVAAEDGKLRDAETYDFIVVGAGTAGCTVAGRLAESGEHKVLLIEIGGYPTPEMDVPAYMNNKFQTKDPSISKLYPSVAQKDAALAKDGIITWWRGQVLGGSSGINSMVFNRGSPGDYNNWGKLSGDPSWNYENLLKHFKKNENYLGDFPSDQRGSNGPISVSRPKFAPGVDEWIEAGKELGYEIGEPNGPQKMGFTPIDFNFERGRRVSSYKGYVENRKGNLQILINTKVNRIIFKGNQAVGVQFTSNSTHLGYAKARKEVIVSCGAVESPVLLMKSGIGPKSVLDAARIPVIKDLPVGESLQDHVTATVTVIFGNRSAAYIPERDLNPEAWKMYNELGDGPYTSTVGVVGQAFLFSSVISPEEKAIGWPDIQLFVQNGNKQSVLGKMASISDLKDSEVTVQWAVYVARPKSKGSVKLDHNNIENPPLIDFQYFSHPDDMQVMLDGINKFLEICEETSAFRRIGCRVPTDVFPACSQHKFRSDPYWKCYVRHFASTGLHTSSTVKMGKGEQDPEAVVDSKLKVIGIEGLSVADASIMPAVTNANINAAVFVIGEKAADMILQRWKTSSAKGNTDFQ